MHFCSIFAHFERGDVQDSSWRGVCQIDELPRLVANVHFISNDLQVGNAELQPVTCLGQDIIAS